MEYPRATLLLIISIPFFLGYSGIATAAILSKPAIVYVDAECGENEVFSRCQAHPICEKSCDNVDIWESVPCIPPKSCTSGCVCGVGYVRDNNRDICILENSCPRVRH